MGATSQASPPRTTDLAALAESAGGCEACELYRNATQTVFGAGSAGARVMLVGEQPGDVEDRKGAPFVGPAGRLLDRALAEAGIDRTQTYVTNAVKHFRWKATDRGNRRLHQSPSAANITACRPWLAAELHAVRPQIVVALGAVASKSLFGPKFTLTEHRGHRLDWPPALGPFADDDTPVDAAFATIHPSAVLRGGAEDRAWLLEGLVADLKQVAAA
jgi:DNA polymerase